MNCVHDALQFCQSSIYQYAVDVLGWKMDGDIISNQFDPEPILIWVQSFAKNPKSCACLNSCHWLVTSHFANIWMQNLELLYRNWPTPRGSIVPCVFIVLIIWYFSTILHCSTLHLYGVIVASLLRYKKEKYKGKIRIHNTSIEEAGHSTSSAPRELKIYMVVPILAKEWDKLRCQLIPFGTPL